LVLTDSGGVQEETTVLGVPCVTLRENTERPCTITEGTNVLGGLAPDGIRRAVVQALTPQRSGKVPPLWDGQASVRIAAHLAGLFQ
jgi:UDP-N-acetylglucosamine 2-epimerase (non-hydrolysing)